MVEGNNTAANILSIISIGVAVAALVGETYYRIIIVSIFAAFLVIYYLSAIYSRVERNTESIKKLEERIQIYQEIANIKADIKALKKKGGLKNE